MIQPTIDVGQNSVSDNVRCRDRLNFRESVSFEVRLIIENRENGERASLLARITAILPLT